MAISSSRSIMSPAVGCRARLGPDSLPHTRSRWKILVENRLVELGGFLEWGDTEFLVEHGNTTPVCLDRTRPVAVPGVKQHQQPVSGLVKRVQVDPTVDGA